MVKGIISSLLFTLCFICLATTVTIEESRDEYSKLLHNIRNTGEIPAFNDVKLSTDDDIWKYNDYLQKLVPAAKEELKSSNNTSPQPLAWAFIPYTIQGRIRVNQTFTWTDPCFSQITAKIVELNSTNCSISFTTTSKKSALCNSFYNINTRERGFFLLLELEHHTLTHVSPVLQYELEDILEHGWMAFLWPLGIAGTVESIANTVLLFAGPDMTQRNVDYFAHNMQWAMRERTAGFVNVSATDILSGTGLAILRLDGLDPLVSWGTGGHTGHSTVALWFDDDNDGGAHGVEDEDDLYIVESIGKENYWPNWGWIKTPWYQWQSQAINAKYHVAMMRLSSEYQAKFSEEAAVNWFNQWEGTQYGIQSFIFIFIDTLLYNLPVPCTPELFTVLATFAERIIPPQFQVSVYVLLIEGYNHRLNSNCTTLHCVFEIIDPMHIDLLELTAWPEQDSYMYNGAPSLTCASFVTGLFKEAGLFNNFDTEINASEQSPKDLYQMAIWDPYWDLPAGCKKADPALPFCQFLGDYSLVLPGWNSITPYAYMNEKCPSLCPLYYRPPVC